MYTFIVVEKYKVLNVDGLIKMFFLDENETFHFRELNEIQSRERNFRIKTKSLHKLVVVMP